jgi:uncharacterized protein YndB with AHSA1/START domain
MEFGKITKQPDGYQVKFERTLNHSIKKVWDAITHTDLLKEWFTDIEMDFRLGGKMKIIFRDEKKTVTHGEILKIEAPHLFIFTWEGELAEWKLSEHGPDKCRLTLTYSKLSDDYAASAPAGFHTLLDRLADTLSGKKIYHAFGTEENDPDQKKLQMLYGREALKNNPQLEQLKPIVMEKILNHSKEKVWRALTDKDQMKQWYFDLSDFKPQVGFEFQFPGQGHKGEKYIHRCVVTEVVLFKRLQYSWAYEGHPGYSIVTFELFDEGTKTKIRLTHEGIETFPKNPDFAKESFNGGWTELITVLLPQYLDKTI